jgi:6-phosphogluconolactonase
MPERVVLPDITAVAEWAAGRIAEDLVEAVADRGRASLALSGGSSPWPMMERLFALPVPWEQVDILQVDERVAPDGHAERNWSRILPLVMASAARTARLHPMPVADGAAAAVQAYRQLIDDLGAPIDAMQLGLGDDGHTASLVPGDPVLDAADTPVAATAGPYQGTVRVTLTYPMLDTARDVVWLVTDADKHAMAMRLADGDRGIPAGRVTALRQVLVLDQAAATG